MLALLEEESDINQVLQFHKLVEELELTPVYTWTAPLVVVVMVSDGYRLEQ